MAVGVRSATEFAPRPDARSGVPARDRSAWILGFVIVLGALIHFSTIGEQSFWYDEAVTRGIVAHGLGHLFAAVPKTESTPPLYYVLVWLWSRVFGLGEVGLRSFSALCGTLTIPVVWAIGRRLISSRVGLIAALLTAVNPFLFWYSQEARSYSLLLLLSALSVLALVRALEAPTWRRLLVWGVVSALAVCAHYFAAFVLVPEWIWLLASLHRRGRIRPMQLVLTAGPVLAMTAALLPLIVRQNDGRAGYIATSTGSLPHRFAQLIKQDIIGDGQPVKVLLTIIGCALVALALALLVRRGTRAERSGALLPLAVGAGGLLLAVVVFSVITDYFSTRNMLPTWPALALVVAAGLGAASAGRLGVLGIAGFAVLSLFCVANVVLDPSLQRDDWRGAARALGSVTGPRAIVADVVAPIPLQSYLRGVVGYPSAGLPIREVDVISLARGSFGRPLIPVTPLPLPGFQVQELTTDSYIVLRYRAPAAVVEQLAAVKRLYPNPRRVATLLQLP
jgi:uncharacterized membrane protein